jgi:DNA processing protein
MLKLQSQDLPIELTRLPQPPKQLFISNPEFENLIKLPRLAIVGSRKISPYGRAITHRFASELAGKGVVIISGLALGVDSVAHSSCLQAGGKTIAVLPTGLDRIYPTSHTHLAQKISQNGGALVTEYPAGSDPRREHFIARNRIIASLAEGVLITEAAEKSGSLHTARFALELGIPVLAVPGPINSPTSVGCNNLIKAGAVPITCIEDICSALKWKLDSQNPEDIHANTKQERLILTLIRSGISDGHQLLSSSELSPPEFNQALTMLEITGRIRPLGANLWAIT